MIDNLERQQIVRDALASGDQLLVSGDFAGSLQAYASVTKLARDQEPADAAWYKMGIVYLHPRNPHKDRRQAIESFDRVSRGFPESMWAEQARVLVEVLNAAESSDRDLAKSKEMLEESRQEAERGRQALEKSQQEIEKSRVELERTRQIIEKSRQVDIEIEEKRRVRGR